MWNAIVGDSLWVGVILSVLLSILVIASLRWNPEIWVHDYPPEVQAMLPPKSALAKRQTVWVAVVMFAIVFGSLGLLVWRVIATQGGYPGFWPIAAAMWIAMQSFNLIDLLIVDWLIVETWRPRFVLVRGAEALYERRFYGFHFRGFLKGFVGITLASGILAGLATAVAALV